MTLEYLVEAFGDSEDLLIRAFLEAIAYEPSRGFAGVSQARWERDFWKPTSDLLAELDKREAGRAPRRRVYPKSGFSGILGWSAFALFAGASAAEHGLRLYRYMRAPVLPFWSTLGNTLGFVVTGVAALVGVRTAWWRVQLFRTRNDPYGEGEDHGG